MSESKNCIIEESEDLSLNRIATVTDNRGGEFVINVDAAVIGLAQLFSDIENERNCGWQLNAGWYEQEIAKLRALAQGHDHE
jgi:predicted Rdx family selenoprotein